MVRHIKEEGKRLKNKQQDNTKEKAIVEDSRKFFFFAFCFYFLRLLLLIVPTKRWAKDKLDPQDVDTKD